MWEVGGWPLIVVAAAVAAAAAAVVAAAGRRRLSWQYFQTRLSRWKSRINQSMDHALGQIRNDSSSSSSSEYDWKHEATDSIALSLENNLYVDLHNTTALWKGPCPRKHRQEERQSRPEAGGNKFDEDFLCPDDDGDPGGN